jgi:hypothetical protein
MTVRLRVKGISVSPLWEFRNGLGMVLNLHIGLGVWGFGARVAGEQTLNHAKQPNPSAFTCNPHTLSSYA